MIKIKYKTEKICDPCYVLTYNYMIGDADGYTKEKITLSLDNPYIERYCRLLNSLTPINGHWGVMLSGSRLKKHYEEGQLTETDYIFLNQLMFEEGYENDEYSSEFFEGVKADGEYFFLVFEGCDLSYIDEYDVEHETYFI